MNIIGVRFAQAIHIGKALDIQSYLEQGTSVLGDRVSLSVHDSTFLKVRFDSGYSQLVPWAQVSTVFASELDDTKSTNQRSKG